MIQLVKITRICRLCDIGSSVSAVDFHLTTPKKYHLVGFGEVGNGDFSQSLVRHKALTSERSEPVICNASATVDAGTLLDEFSYEHSGDNDYDNDSNQGWANYRLIIKRFLMIALAKILIVKF